MSSALSAKYRGSRTSLLLQRIPVLMWKGVTFVLVANISLGSHRSPGSWGRAGGRVAHILHREMCNVTWPFQAQCLLVPSVVSSSLSAAPTGGVSSPLSLSGKRLCCLLAAWQPC